MRDPWSRGYNPTARRLMWLGVSLFSVVIFFMWGWALRLQLSSVAWTDSPENKLVQNGKTDWDTIFEQNRQRTQEEKMKGEVKQALEALMIKNSATVTPVPTTTMTTTVATSTTSTTR